MSRFEYVLFCVFAVCFAAGAIWYGSSLIKADGKACADSGGVQVKTYDGFVCIAAKVMK